MKMEKKGFTSCIYTLLLDSIELQYVALDPYLTW